MNTKYHKKSFTKIPIFEEISLSRFDLPFLIKLFKTKRIGQIPYYVILHELQDDELDEALDHIAEALITLKHNPYFPYPFYVVTKQRESHSHLPLVSSVEGLPQHYFKKARRLKNKEMVLLNKNSIVGAKVANLDMSSLFKDIQSVTQNQRQLYDLCKEVDFYETISEQLSRAQKDEWEKYE